MSEILLETKNINVQFPIKKNHIFEKRKYLDAVSNVSIQIKKGETFGLVGESGCGKSTLANATLGFVPTSSGQILFNGQDICQMDQKELKIVRLQMQKIFQDPKSSLNPRFTVFQAISEPLIIQGQMNNEEIEKRTIEMIEAVGLQESDLKRYTYDFSGGQQQRIAIARALITKPDYIVCDEPVSSLDVSIHAQIINLLMDLQEKTGVTYLFISHNLAVVKKICSTIAIMYFGKIVEYGDARKIFKNPLHPYTKKLISAILSMQPKDQINLTNDYSETIIDVENTSLIEIEPNHYVAMKIGERHEK